VAGVRKLRAAGTIAADARVVCVLTGHLMKDPDIVVAYHSGGGKYANAPIEIGATVGEVERVLRR
jgi:threonine synthase